ncbi:MAG TPA: hypothetical protein EYG86_00305, partial [Crocinitomicaceae bacterium]|nr:hypothetical protein [Crocinitomicaceae bacterium]
MKKLLLSGTALFSVLSLSAQVNVSTTPSNKVAVLEEYTGNYCTYCPDGHKIADQISATGAVSLKIQTGSFSGTDPIFGGSLQTPTGNTIAGPYDSQGYPNGTVSRAPGNLGVGRGTWISKVNAIQSQISPVNLYLVSDIDVTTGQLNVSVEYYYTAAEANATNYLHIGYYQDDIPAMQIDPLNINPSQYYMASEDLYDFDHCFRDMVNGTWGEVINTTGIGATGIINHTITLPNAFNGFDVENGAIKVFAFMSTTSQGEILTAAKNTPTYNNLPNTDEIGDIYATKLQDED